MATEIRSSSTLGDNTGTDEYLVNAVCGYFNETIDNVGIPDISVLVHGLKNIATYITLEREGT